MQNKVSFDSDLAKYGIGLFETIKVVEGKAIFLDEHLERLYKSIKKLEIPFTVDKEVLKEEIKEVAAKLDYQALRITIFDQGYNFSTRDIDYGEENYKQGYKLTISSINRGNNPLYKHKTTNYFTNIKVRKEAQNSGYNEALFLNPRGFVLETTMANIFFIKGQKLYTPQADLGLLPGIIRGQVIIIAQKLGLEVKEILIDKGELPLFNFAFITNSLLGLMKVKEIAGINYDNNNQIFTQLQQELKKKEMRS